MESYDDSLETFMNSKVKPCEEKFHGRWTILLDLCHQLAETISWLHCQRINNLGSQVQPHNILLCKRSNTEDALLKIVLPQRLNLLNNIDHLLDNSRFNIWTHAGLDNDIDPYKRDIASVAMLIFYILSNGGHCYQMNKYQGKQQITENMKNNSIYLDALKLKCFCETESCDGVSKENLACKYRRWVNSLAIDFITGILTKTSPHLESTQLFRHPFFWKNAKIMNFIEKAYNFIDGQADEETKKKFSCKNNSKQSDCESKKISVGLRRVANQQQTNADSSSNKDMQCKQEVDHLESIYPATIAYLKEYLVSNKKEKTAKVGCIDDYFSVLKQIRNKVY